MFASWLIAPLLVNAGWAAALSWASYVQAPITLFSLFAEIVRDLVWLIFLAAILRYARKSQKDVPRIFLRIFFGSVLLGVLLLFLLVALSTFKISVPVWLGYDFRVIVQVLFALSCLIFVEQILRNTLSHERWGIKFFCIGLGALFAYDFYMYSDALLFRELDPNIWYARGVAEVLALGMVALGISRMPMGDSRLMFSRQIVFYTTGMAAAGAYLLVISLGGYYIMVFGGEWAAIIRNVFIFSCIIGFVVLVFSGQIRARLRVFVDKHFLNAKYDYKNEWLSVIREMSAEDESKGSVETRTLRVMLTAMDCQAAALWVRDNKTNFICEDQFGFGEFEGIEVSNHSRIIQFLEESQWVINIDEYHMGMEQYPDFLLPEWIEKNPRVWLIVPLMLQSKLHGFVILSRPRAEQTFGWEDVDLLKTLGRQLATHLAHARSASALAHSRQFEAFNRLSAYVIHDLKNLVSQLDLVVKNAQKHKHNPEFMDDAISTVGNAVNRMNKLLIQLRGGGVISDRDEQANIRDIVAQAVREKSATEPIPCIEGEGVNATIRANNDKLVSVIGHLVQNAQEATSRDGHVEVRTFIDGSDVVIEVEDNGCGMSDSFIRDRLFTPFDTTKGLTGMGIGAHESKLYIEQLGGKLRVKSEVGKGTLFTVRLPLSSNL